jgi:hypothetical protein
LTVLEDIGIGKIREKWDSGRIHRTFLSLYDIFIAIIRAHPQFLQYRFRFDAYSPGYWCKLKVSDFCSGDM